MCTYMILYGRNFATTRWTTDNARISLIWWYPFMSILCIVDACYQIATGKFTEMVKGTVLFTVTQVA